MLANVINLGTSEAEAEAGECLEFEASLAFWDSQEPSSPQTNKQTLQCFKVCGIFPYTELLSKKTCIQFTDICCLMILLYLPEVGYVITIS